MRNTGTKKLLGFKVNSLFGMAACPATMNSAYVKAAFDNGFDIVTYKTQRSIPYPANSFPNVMQVDLDGALSLERAKDPIVGRLPEITNPSDFTLANSCGINSEGPNFWIDDMTNAVNAAHKGQILIGSVAGTLREDMKAEEYYKDFSYTAKLAAQAGAHIIELNLSCPNVASEGVLCYDKDAVLAICKETRRELSDKPLFIKIGYFSASQEGLLREIIKESAKYIDGVAAINTIAAPVVTEDGEQAFPGPGRERAGISGAAVKWAGIHMTERLAGIRESLGLSFVIFGMGGVMSPKDYEDYRAAGADAVQAVTGAMWNPNLAAEIKDSLR